MNHLPPEQIDAVIDAALQAGLTDAQARSHLLHGIMPLYVGSLPTHAAPALQLRSDLARMNGVERLIDGTVPLQVWLQNAVKVTFEDAPHRVFQRALDTVAVQASAEPAPPPEDQLAELKEEIIFQDDTVPYEYLRLGWESGAAVARLSVPPFEHGQPIMAGTMPGPPHIGTGWLITSALLMTNHHVVAARSRETIDRLRDDDLRLQGAGTIAEFDLDADNVAVPGLACRELVAWDRTLDYAVLRLETPTQRRPLPLASARLRSGKGSVAVNIIQHPMGESKRVGLRNNLVTDSTERDLRYFTDTRKGSSGSPVLDDTWRVVALHRGSRRVEGSVTFQGRTTAYVNVGTQIHAILADLGERFPAIRKEIDDDL